MTTTAVNTIMEELARVFAETDAMVLEGTKKFAEERAAAVSEYQKSEQSKVDRKAGTSVYYKKLFELWGGKGMHDMLWGRDQAGREEQVTKHCAAVVRKRNANISTKLVKAGVNEVISSGWAHTNDGFNGFFSVGTDAGNRMVKISTILAGGYNIQCLHQRVLVNVK